jgi:hypothetical protein
VSFLRARALFVVSVILFAYPGMMFVPAVFAVDTVSSRLVGVAVTVALGALISYTCTRMGDRWTPRVSWILVIALIVASAVVIPAYLVAVQHGVFGGLGGDRGQALDIALDRLFSGKYPYSELTYDGGRITPLPGGLLLSVPAFFILTAAYFAFAYLIPAAALISRKVDFAAAAVFSLCLLLSPCMWADAGSGGDLVSTAMLAFAVGLATLRAASRGGVSRYWWPVFLGVVCASRVTTLIVIILVAVLVARVSTWRLAIRQALLAVLVALALSLPLYLINPEEFSPLHTSKFIEGPIGMLLAIAMTLAVCAWAYKSQIVGGLRLSGQLALVLALHAVLLTLIPILLDGGATLVGFSGYAVLGILAPIALIPKHSNSKKAVSLKASV